MTIKNLWSRLSSPLPLRERLWASLFVLAGAAPVAAQTGTDPFPDVDYRKYQSNMSFTGQVRIDGEPQADGTIVAVYCGDEIRGKDVVFSQGSRSRFFMFNAMGESTADRLHFKVCVGGRIIEVDQGVTFTADAELGTIRSYYYIDLPAPVATTFTPDGWATVCLPFNAEVPPGVTVWNATAVADGQLALEPFTATQPAAAVLPAATPVLLQADGLGSCEWLARVGGGTIQVGATVFSGTLEPTGVAPGSVLTLGHSAYTGALGFWPFQGTVVPPYSAYIADPAAAPTGAAIVTHGEQPPTTAIGAPPHPLLPHRTCYSLTGQPFDDLQDAPRGIYIINGQKVVR